MAYGGIQIGTLRMKVYRPDIGQIPPGVFEVYQ